MGRPRAARSRQQLCSNFAALSGYSFETPLIGPDTLRRPRRRCRSLLEELHGRTADLAMNIDEMLARFSAAGTPSEVRRRIDELSSTGLDEIVLYPCIAAGQTRETVSAMIKTLGACR